jgi:REP element-mobilizing transposase RayT
MLRQYGPVTQLKVSSQMSPATRLKTRDYSAQGFYFLTICANYKKCIFGRISDGKVARSALGQIVYESWLCIPDHFSKVRLHEFTVMPNHFHGILELTSSLVVAQHAAPVRAVSASSSGPVFPGSLSAIVRSFKGEVTRRARIQLNWPGEIWQRNYFDHVIRDGNEFAAASRYIAENPQKWEWDVENQARKNSESKAILAQHAAPLQGKRL